MLQAPRVESTSIVTEAFGKQQSPRATADIERECEAYAEHITNLLSDQMDTLSPRYLPFTGSTSYCDALLESLRDGILLAHIINCLKPGAVPIHRLNYGVDMASLNRQHSKAVFEVGENLNACVEGAKRLRDIGVVLVNIGANDILHKNVDIVLGLVWQLIRAQLLQNVNLVAHPELIRLLQHGESLKTLLSMNAEQLLLRWFNFHLKRSGQPSITNFSADIADCNKYYTLLESICPPSDALDTVLACRSISTHAPGGMERRAQALLTYAATIECRRFVTVRDIVHGNARLNMAFTAGLFNRYIGIMLPTDQQVRALYTRNEELARQLSAMEKTLAARDEALAAAARDMSDMQAAVETRVSTMEDQCLAQLERLKIAHTTDADKNRIKLEITVAKKDAEIVEAETRHRHQLADMEATLTSKHQADMRASEQKYRAELARVCNELQSLKTSFLGFFEANSIQPPQTVTATNGTSPSAMALTGQVRECVIKVIESFYEKIDDTAAITKKLGHMEHVNSVIGDKIQEYAESVIHQKRRDKRSSLGAGLFKK